MDDERRPAGPWAWPFSLFAGGGAPWYSLAPARLDQPINPGWSFGNVYVTRQNSSAPEVEREIVSRHSYGRQIGRLMGAVCALADAVPAAAGDPRVRSLQQLAAEVSEIKRLAAPARLERLTRELRALRDEDPAGWQALLASMEERGPAAP